MPLKTFILKLVEASPSTKPKHSILRMRWVSEHLEESNLETPFGSRVSPLPIRREPRLTVERGKSEVTLWKQHGEHGWVKQSVTALSLSYSRWTTWPPHSPRKETLEIKPHIDCSNAGDKTTLAIVNIYLCVWRRYWPDWTARLSYLEGGGEAT